MLLAQKFSEGEVVVIHDEEFIVTSVGAHSVEGHEAGYSYVFRLKSEVESDQEAAERAAQAEAERQAAAEEARQEAERAEAEEKEEVTNTGETAE